MKITVTVNKAYWRSEIPHVRRGIESNLLWWIYKVVFYLFFDIDYFVCKVKYRDVELKSRTMGVIKKEPNELIKIKGIN